MLTIHANTPRPAPNESTHAVVPGATPQDPAGFASLLRQSQGAQPAFNAPPRAAVPMAPIASASSAKAERATGHQTGADAPDSPNSPDTDDTSSHDAIARNRAVPRSKPRAAAPDAAAPRNSTEHDVAAKTGDEHHSEATANTAPPTTPPGAMTVDPGMLHWLASLQREAPVLGKATAAATATATDDAASTVSATMRDARPVPLDSRSDDAKDALHAAADHGQARGNAMPIEAVLSKPAPETFSASKDPITPTLLATAVTPPPTTRHEAPVPVAVALATPIDAPEFPSALGLQLSVFARNGIEHAELQLNPAEMGPVSVQITMDGTQARVDFGADLAATRQAIEAGLPELASALRDAGFTLAGGGVSQHSQGRSDRRDPSGRGDRRAPNVGPLAGADEAPHATRTTVRLGGLDLYA
jgi:flagellar hook-length control protein FliK